MNASPLGCHDGRVRAEQSVLVDGLARSLGDLGHRVTIYVRRDHLGEPSPQTVGPNVRLELIDAGPAQPLDGDDGSLWVEAFAAPLARAWSTDPPDAVHAFGTNSGRAAVAAAGGTTGRIVQTFVYLPAVGRIPAGHVVPEAAVARAAARIIATSSAQVFALLGMGAKPSAIKFVPCGVDLERFAPRARAQAAADAPLRICTLGGLAECEGVDDVVSALALVERVELCIGGGRAGRVEGEPDSDVDRLVALAERLGVANRVVFRGPVQRADVAAFLQSADVVICPPHGDSIGTVALEAMACGVPLVVTAVGGLLDVVADGMTGVCVPPRQPRQLAYTLEALRVDRERRDRLGRRAAERTAARYGWLRIAAETAEIYGSITAGASRLGRDRAEVLRT